MDPSNTIERDPKSFGRQPDSDLQQRPCRYQGFASRLAALRRRLVEAERLQPTEIKPGGGQHRHLARQHHRRLLEQQREPAARARPRRPDALDPMVGAVGARHIGRDGAVAQWRWKKFRRRQVKLAKSWALHDRPQSGHGNSAPRSAAASICNSLGRLSVSRAGRPASKMAQYPAQGRVHRWRPSTVPRLPVSSSGGAITRSNTQPIPLGTSRSQKISMVTRAP